MTVYTAPEHQPHLRQRPLTEPELDTVRAAINSPVSGPHELVEQIVAAVFTALQGNQNAGDTGSRTDSGPEPGRFTIPISQWTAILGAAYDRAYTWGAAIEVGMELANLMPGSYDDPQTPTPRLGPADGQPRIYRLDVTREAADTVAACHAHVTALAAAYGSGSERHQAAAGSWHRQLTLLLAAQLAPRTVVHSDGPLSLSVSTDIGTGFEIAFHGELCRCTTTGCHAIADSADSSGTQLRWRPGSPGAVVLDHEHQPSYPPELPQPGVWAAHS